MVNEPVPGASLHLIDDAALLLNAARQELFLINARAAYIWCCLEDGFGVSETEQAYAADFGVAVPAARDEVRDTMAAWRRLGLIDGGTPARTPETGAPEGPEPAPPVPKGGVEARRGYRVLGTPFEVRYPSVAVAERVDPVLAQFATDVDEGAVAVDVLAAPEGFAIRVDGVAAQGCDSAEALTPQVKSAILVAAVNRHGFAAYLHAAVLRRHGALLLLPGQPGSGKTTLCLALSRRGFAYHSDEAALLDPDSMRVRGVPISPCVKDTGWPIAEALYPGLAKITAHDRVDGKRVKYLPAPIRPGDPDLDRAWPVRWLIFPRYAADEGTAIRPISRGEALRRLLLECNAWRLQLTAESVGRLVTWIGGIACHELVFASLDRAIALADEVCRDEP